VALQFLKRGGGTGERAEMAFIDHLEELRWHIIRALLAIIICGIFVFANIDWIYDNIIAGPINKGFVTYNWLCQLSHKAGWGDKLCLPPANVELQSTTFGGPFITSITMSFICGFILAFPYVFWEVWKFIKPALKPNELKNTRGSIFFVTFFFLCGVAFGYFLLAPFTFSFLTNYKLGTGAIIVTRPTIADYTDNLVDIIVGSGLAFELPVVSFVLTRIGLVTPRFLVEYRKYAYVALLVIAAVITPSPDWMSQMIVVVPLITLYEISIVISRRVYKQEEKKEKEEWS
jgi:sec-independent protein translocase protein TatC